MLRAYKQSYNFFLLWKKVAEGWIKGDLKLWKFLTFSVFTTPSPTVYDGPPSPSWARIFSALIWFANLIVLARSNQLISPLFFWAEAGRRVPSIAQFQSVRFHSSSNSAVACYENPNAFSELTKAWNPEIQDFSDFCSEILPQMFSGLAVMHQNVPTFWSPPWVSFSKKHHRVERSLRAALSRWSKSS